MPVDAMASSYFWWQVKQSALPALSITSRFSFPVETVSWTSWHDAHSRLPLKSRSASIVLPSPEFAVDGSSSSPSAVARAVLYVNEIGWCALRSVPRSADPEMLVVPVAPPNESRATDPSWQLKQSFEAPAGCPTEASSVPLL